MRHVPHLLLPGPWPEAAIALERSAVRHLTKVLRLAPGARVGYTDGAGTIGDGILGDDGVTRGEERTVPPVSPRVVLAVAPPHDTGRARYVVEKAGELGVAEVRWVTTSSTQSGAPKAAKAEGWAVAALQQARGAHLTRVTGPVRLGELDPSRVAVADPSGGAADPSWWEGGEVTVLIGPEGGLTAQELDRFPLRIGLGAQVLRVETAAVVAVALVLDAARRHAR